MKDPCIPYKFCGKEEKHKNKVERMRKEPEEDTKEIESAIFEEKTEMDKIEAFQDQDKGC